MIKFPEESSHLLSSYSFSLILIKVNFVAQRGLYRFFVSRKDVDFIDKVNEELIDEVIGQTVDIYKVSLDDTEENMYGESTTKYFDQGFTVNCLINFVEPTTELTDIGSDVMTSIEMYFHRTTLSEANFYPEIGDIVDWNDIYFEINTVTEPQLIGGHTEYKHQIKANAHRIRLSSLQIEDIKG